MGSISATAEKTKGKSGFITGSIYQSQKEVSMEFVKGCFGAEERVLGDIDVNHLIHNTGLDKDEIEAQYETFLSNHKSGRISKREFQAMLRESYPSATASDLAKLAQHIFRMYDINQNGHIDFTEFMLALNIMSNGSAEQNLRQIFRVFDINNDGAISLKELKKVINDLHQLIEVKKGASKDMIANEVFKEMDDNEDCIIDQDEFVSACLTGRRASTSLTLNIVSIFV